MTVLPCIGGLTHEPFGEDRSGSESLLLGPHLITLNHIDLSKNVSDIFELMSDETAPEPHTQDNPAGRLNFWIGQIRDVISKPTRQANEGTQIFAEVFGLDPTRRTDVLSAVADLLKLPEQIRESIRKCPDVSDTLLGLLPDVDRYLESLLGGLSNQGVGIAQAGVFANLEVISEQLSRFSPEIVPDHEVLDNLRSSISDLIDEISATEMDEDLSSFLIDELLNVRFAIERFDLLGEKPLRDAFAKVLGDAQIQRETVEADDSHNAQDMKKKFETIMRRVYEVLSFGGNALSIATLITEALEAGHIHP